VVRERQSASQHFGRPAAVTGVDDRQSQAEVDPPWRGGRNPGPFEVRVEIVVLEGEVGRELGRRQAAVMRKVLRWLHENPQM
jgi:hypothetical protein